MATFITSAYFKIRNKKGRIKTPHDTAGIRTDGPLQRISRTTNLHSLAGRYSMAEMTVERLQLQQTTSEAPSNLNGTSTRNELF